VTEGLRAALAAVVVAVAAGAGVAAELQGEPVAAPQAARPGSAVFQRAAFCPPIGDAASGTLSVAAADRDADVLIEPPRRVTALRGGRVVMVPARASPTTVTGLGGRLGASATLSLEGRADGAAAVSCTEAASTEWFFPEGSSSLAADMRLLVFNPFLDEAVVRVTFYTPGGPKAKASLADVAVPSRRAVEIAVNEYIFRQSLLAVGIEAERGRVVAWRRLHVGRRRARALLAGLGAPEPAPVWYLPEGGVGRGYDESVTLLNPTADEATVTLTVVTSARVVQPARLVELAVPPGSSRRVDLFPADAGPRRGVGASVLVTSTNSTPVVAERVVAYSGAAGRGIASEVGAREAARRWFLGPAVARAARDHIAVMNAGSHAARVRVRLATGRRSVSPPSLRAVRVPAGLRVTIDVSRWTGGEAWAVLLSADEPIVAERRAGSRSEADVAAVMGIPLTDDAGASH
jgi:hypothetical protein